MSDTYVLDLFVDLRRQLLDSVSDLSAAQMSTIPRGFRNHVHWQLGHVLTITDQIIFGFSGLGTRLPSEYNLIFATGTSPTDWTDQAPGIDEFKRKLREQQAAIRDELSSKLAHPVADKQNFLGASVIGELFHVLIAHEAMHLGMLTAMVKVLSV